MLFVLDGKLIAHWGTVFCYCTLILQLSKINTAIYLQTFKNDAYQLIVGWTDPIYLRAIISQSYRNNFEHD